MHTVKHEDKTLSVSAIEYGTVIDHIEAGQALNILKFLQLNPLNQTVTVGIYLPSPSIGRKDLIKIHDVHLSKDCAHLIAIFSPKASIYFVENYEVGEKIIPEVPQEVSQILPCLNPQCITRHEHSLTTFSIQKTKNHTLFTCKYCEKSFKHHELTIPKGLK